ncbi:uncharacterized protein G2W53_026180 [Senna tora]|uniref:Uncharacterized protein n=1 Tax=Senna tora TaxID=362788 RepID=A0A834TF80_9FABA|nr:uncharacterized protein G2W53_026180 [Senna tora]
MGGFTVWWGGGRRKGWLRKGLGLGCGGGWGLGAVGGAARGEGYGGEGSIGIAYCDLKPENVRIQQSGHVRKQVPSTQRLSLLCFNSKLSNKLYGRLLAVK